MCGRFDPVTDRDDEPCAAHTRRVVERGVTLRRLLGTMTALGCLTACGFSSHADDEPGDPAVWYVVADQNLRPNSTGFMVTVTRTGCSSGVQGEPERPVIDAGVDTITITFRIDPHISSGTCEGTPGVVYRLHLGEPLGERDLVDGGCRVGDGLASTEFCLRDGVRVRWRHGQPRLVS
jgi:hypothetical protein